MLRSEALRESVADYEPKTDAFRVEEIGLRGLDLGELTE